MNIKLFRIASLVLVFASILSMMPAQPAQADPATDYQAVNIIAACKGSTGTAAPGSDCEKYRSCVNATQGDEVCKAIGRLSSIIPTFLTSDTLAKCVATVNERSNCITAWATCISYRIKDDKLEAGAIKQCNDLVAAGNIAEAEKPVVDDDSKTTCAIVGVGWIVCPVVSFLSLIVDGAYAFVGSLLTVQPLLTTGNLQDNGIYSAWSIMRNFANVAFVIAFLLIVFSQITSIGISNYGIKKMLPRLVVAAVLVNISYWVCAALIDISNILGTSLNGLFDSIKDSMPLPSTTTDDFGATAGTWTGIAGGLLAGIAISATFLYVGLSALLPALLAALLAIVTVFLVLTLRQALIILLVVVSPLAFVAFLLPNTESLFKQWRGLLQTLLLMYPIIAVIFGASALASQVVMGSATGPYKIVIQIMGAMISIVPLALTPIIMRTAGGLLNRFGGIINNPNKGPFDRMRKGAEGYRDYRKNIASERRFGRSRGEGFTGNLARKIGPEGSRRQRAASWIAGAGVTAGRNRELRQKNAEEAAKEGALSYVANRAATDDQYAQKIAGPTGDVSKVRASAISAQVREFNEKVGAEKATMSRSSAAELHTIMRDAKSSEERRSAAAGQLMKVGSDNDIHEALNYVGTQARDANGNFTDSAMSSIQQQIASDMGSRKPLSLGATDISNLNKGNYDGDFSSKIRARLSAGKISAEALASASNDELVKINDFVRTNSAALKTDPATADAMRALERDIAEFRTNPQLAGKQPAHEIASRMDELHGLL